jgi:hypothetical protein
MIEDFTILYKGFPVPLPTGEIPSHNPKKDDVEGCFVYDEEEMHLFDDMSHDDLLYYERLLRVSEARPDFTAKVKN